MNEQGKEFILSKKSTIKKTSIISAEEGSFIDLDEPVVDFDKVKDDYVKKLNLHLSDKPNSSDALLWKEEEKIYLIEYKSGGVDFKELFNIHMKVNGSAFLLMDILDEPLEYLRKNVEYVLVYNPEKKHTVKCYDATGVLDKKEVNFSSARVNISSRLNERAKIEHIQFDLKRYIHFLYCNVHTFTPRQFENFFKIKRTRNT